MATGMLTESQLKEKLATPRSPPPIPQEPFTLTKPFIDTPFPYPYAQAVLMMLVSTAGLVQVINGGRLSLIIPGMYALMVLGLWVVYVWFLEFGFTNSFSFDTFTRSPYTYAVLPAIL